MFGWFKKEKVSPCEQLRIGGIMRADKARIIAKEKEVEVICKRKMALLDYLQRHAERGVFSCEFDSTYEHYSTNMIIKEKEIEYLTSWGYKVKTLTQVRNKMIATAHGLISEPYSHTYYEVSW